MHYTETAQSGNSYSHMWDVASMKTLDGGFLFDKTSVPAGTVKLPKGVFLKADFGERTAKMIKVAVLHEAITAASEVVKIKKGALLLATDILGIGIKAVVVGAVDTSNAAYDSFAIVAGSLGALGAGAVLQQFSAASTGGTKGVYTLTIGTNPTADDKLSVNGIEYTFAAAAGEGVIAVGATATATAANLQDTLEADNQDFVVKANGAKLVFTQKVAGVGAIPAIVVTKVEGTGTLAATIAQTTAGVLASAVPVNPDGLNPFEVEIDSQPSCSIMFRADGIVKSRLPQATTSAIEAALTHCQFLNI